MVDRRGRGTGLAVGGGVGSILIALLVMFLGGDPGQVIPQDDGSSGTGGAGYVDPKQEPLKDFASVILADTEDTWPALLAKKGIQYEDPKLVLYTGGTRTGCGIGQAAMGPFYCPMDQQVYLDLGFFNELDRQLGAPGDFAQAYVIAHEIGHHVQKLTGVADKTQAARGRMGEEQANALSVRVELQADCYAGIWAHHAQQQRHVLEPGDIEEGLNAASAIGDDTLQKKTQGRVVPESFTHGSSAERVAWFKRGYETGSMDACDTFRR